MKSLAVIVLLAGATGAEPAQLQADVGLAVVGIGYEQPLGDHLAIMGEGQLFGTYFLPWFDLGNNLIGGGVEARATWFRGEHHHGLYATGFLRFDEVSDEWDTKTFGWCGGGIVGWALPVGTTPLDVRVGAGVQWMRFQSETTDIDTPFITLDLVVGWRLGPH